MLESSCDPVKPQYENDFEAIHKCELATIRMVGGEHARSRGDLIDQQTSSCENIQASRKVESYFGGLLPMNTSKRILSIESGECNCTIFLDPSSTK